jgi:glycosyltransferase involved in cell wall biosynthesis
MLHYSAREIIAEINDIKGLKIISKKPFVKTFPFLSEKRHFKKIYEDFKPDITHTGYVWQVGILASNIDVHPHLSMVWGSDILTEPDKRWFYKILVKKVLLQADHIQCDAEVVKKKIISDYLIKAEKITVFPWGIDLNIFKPLNKSGCRNNLKLDQNKFIIIYNRFLEPIYGVMDLLEGFKRFCTNKNDVSLIMLSDGSLKKQVIRFISDNNLESKIHLNGRVNNSELPIFLNASDIYISTSQSDGSSLSMLEAMACGTPMVLTDMPAIREWVSENDAILIPRNNPELVNSALEKYYNDRQLMKEYGQISMKIASERANWDLNYAKLTEIYSNIIVNR